MSRQTIIKYAAYFAFASIAADIAWQIYKRVIRPKKIHPKIEEVLITNELTQICLSTHRSKLRKDVKCSNKFCFLSNMKRIIQLIDSAETNILLSMYIFTSSELCRALQRACKRGVKIRILCEKTMAYASGSQMIVLYKMGIPIRFQCSEDNRSLMHHKLCIIDGEKYMEKEAATKNREEIQPILLMGSMNWTNQGLSGNWDSIMITSNLKFVQIYEEEFYRMWSEFDKNGEFTEGMVCREEDFKRC